MHARRLSRAAAAAGTAATLAIGLSPLPAQALPGPSSSPPSHDHDHDRSVGHDHGHDQRALARAPLAPFLRDARRVSSRGGDLDVLYVGAHPDDEAGRLSVFGEWGERFGVETGVVTVTRGEGGGNAVGPEEGPALGLIREREERRAVGEAGLRDVHNFDKADFYYSVSAPLHQQAWNERDALARLVRVYRETTPDVVVTMDTAPSPGNHGGHQEAARLAVEAYYAAGDRSRFPGQLRREGLRPHAPAKLFTFARGTQNSPGESCTTSYEPTEPTDDVYGVWSGRRSEDGRTWAQVERDAQREYASQGWSGFPDVSADPAQLGCDYLRQIDARVPFTRGDLSEDAAGSRTMLEGAVRAPRGDRAMPLGTGFDVRAGEFDVVPGGTTTMKVRLTAPLHRALPGGRFRLRLPDGWTAAPVRGFDRLRPGTSVRRTVRVTAPESAGPDRVLVGVVAASGRMRGFGDQQLEVVPAVVGEQERLPRLVEFDRWADRLGVEQLSGLVDRVLTLPSGGTRTVGVDVTNRSDAPATGTVTLDLPAGFAADGPASFEALAPGETRRVEVEVTNTDDSLPTSNQGGDNGDYDYEVVTESQSGSGAVTARAPAALELVPVATVSGEAGAPTLDGTVEDGEYDAEIDLSRRWEGTACDSAEDCSATGFLTRSDDALHVAVQVTDDTLGSRVEPTDCKRHWRTDSVELAVDPDGRSENTSTTFKVGMFPTTTGGVSCASRDADNDQGPIGTFEQVGADGTPQRAEDDTAPGFEMVSRLEEPYTGYTIEATIPFATLPSTVDPERMGFNAFVYDSDTQDLAGQTRLGWSTWGGVQGDPYRWGRVLLEGPAPAPVLTQEPVLDFPALQSVASPPSILQSLRTGLPLSGGPEARRGTGLVSARPVARGVAVRLRSEGPGTAHLFAMGAGGVVGQRVVETTAGTRRVVVRTDGRARRVLLGFDADGPGTSTAAVRVR